MARRPSHRQRQASRRNLQKARAAQARRRRSPGLPINGATIRLVLYLWIGIVVLFAVFAGIAVTHGAVLLLIPLGIALWVRQRRQRRNAEAAEAQRIWQARMERAHHLDALLATSPAEFERTIATLLAASGFVDVEVVGGPGDLTADITCRDDVGRYVVVQCKQYWPTQAVGSGPMQQFIGMGRVHHEAERMIYVTTARYTKPAQELAERHHIELVDGSALIEWAKRHRVSDGYIGSSQPPPPPVTLPPPPPPSGRWEQGSWRVCQVCGTRTRWRDPVGEPRCQACEPVGS